MSIAEEEEENGYYKVWPNAISVLHYAELCQNYRRLDQESKLREMAEKCIEFDVRMIKYFNDRAKIALAEVMC